MIRLLIITFLLIINSLLLGCHEAYCREKVKSEDIAYIGNHLEDVKCVNAEKENITSNYEKAQQYLFATKKLSGYDNLVQLARNHTNKDIAAVIFCRLALDYITYANDPEGLALFNEATQLYNTKQLLLSTGIYLYTKGIIAKKLERNQAEASAIWNELMQYAKVNNNIKMLAIANYNKSIIFYDFKEYDSLRALINFITPAQLNQLRIREYINLYNAVALSYVHEQRYNEALPIFNKCLQYATENKDTAWMGIINGNIGHLYYEQNNISKAIAFLKSDVIFSEADKEYSSASHALCLLGEIYYLHLNKPDSTEFFFSKALQLVKQYHILASKLSIYNKLHLFYYKTGQFEKAYVYHSKYMMLSDSIKPIELNYKYKNIENKLRLSDKDHQIEILNAKNELQKQESRRTRSILINLSVIVLLLIIILVISYRSNKREQHTNQKISQQKNEIEQKAIELEKSNTTKDKIFAVLSHDLRSPLASLKGILDLLDNEKLTTEEFSKVKNKVSEQLHELNFLLDNLLHWSKNQLSNNTTTKKEAVDVKQIIDNNIKLYASIAEAKNIKVYNHTAQPIAALAAYEEIDVVLRNLLSNAIKFTPFNGSINIKVEYFEPKQIKVSVEDNGVGMTNEMIHQLFSNQYHKSTKGTKGEKGTGIGLWLCKEIVEKYGGTINAKQNLKQGVTFSFTIPTA